MKVKILKAANQDLMEGFHFYEKQAEGIGDYFLDSLFDDIDSLIENTGIHPVYFKRYHRMLANHFPFAVYYRIDRELILVYAVLDCRSNPAWIKGRLLS